MSKKTQKTEPAGPQTLVIDIGGSGIKSLLLDADGAPVGERRRLKTPKQAGPEQVLSVCAALIEERLESGARFERVSVGFPGVVVDGVIHTAPNLHGPGWAGYDLGAALKEKSGHPVRVINDAELLGFGAIEGKGVELALTLGTGMGAGLYVDGRLVPNLELGHHPFEKGKTYEERIGAAALKKAGKKAWNRRVARVIAQLRPIFNFRRLHLGGGNTKKLNFELPEDVRVFGNVEGMLGGYRLWELDR